MARQKRSRRASGTGSIVERGEGSRKRLYLRKRYRDDKTGKMRDKLVPVSNRTEANEKAVELQHEFKKAGPRIFDGDRMTFNEVADEYERLKIHEAEYVQDRKVSGMRDHRTAKERLAVLRRNFGRHRIKSITWEDLHEFKLHRLRVPTRTGKRRTLATVNRELQQMRAVLNFAQRKGWLLRSPFHSGHDTLISTADEVKRLRILSLAEEAVLLANCTGKREHLRALIICAVDTAMRQAEILSLTWQDVDLEAGLITIRARNTKTLTERSVGITDRLRAELIELQKHTIPGGQVFTCGRPSTGWKSLLAASHITGLRFHDLRATATTRMLEAGNPAHLVMKITGHTQADTFLRYARVDSDVATRSASALTAWMESKGGSKDDE